MGIASVERGCPLWVCAVDGEGGFAEVADHVDSRCVEGGHAGFVIFGWVDCVGADGVGAEFDEVGDVSCASCCVCERVCVGGLL